MRAIDESKLVDFEGLVNDLGEEFVVELIQTFLLALPGRMYDLGEAVRLGDRVLIGRLIHSFKLSCQIVGAADLVNCLLLVKSFSELGDTQALLTAYLETEIAARSAESELRKILDMRSREPRKAF